MEENLVGFIDANGFIAFAAQGEAFSGPNGELPWERRNGVVR
jgi:hypothetical protein